MILRRLAPFGLAVAAFAAPSARADEPTTDRACVSEPYRAQGTTIACPSLGFVAVLPGRAWSIRERVEGAPRVLLSARLAPYFHVAVSTAEPAPAGAPAMDPPAILRDLYARALAGSRGRGLELTPPAVGESRPNRPTIAYETRGLVVGGQAQRSLHVWTFARRPDGTRLHYHASWTGPADAFDPDLPETLEAMTAGFVLVDGAGRALAD